MSGELSNNKAFKFLSLEFLLSMLMIAITVGVTWGSLASAQEAQAQEIAELKGAQNDMKAAIDEITNSVATITANQENETRRADEAREQRQRMEDKLDRLTERLLAAD